MVSNNSYRGDLGLDPLPQDGYVIRMGRIVSIPHPNHIVSDTHRQTTWTRFGLIFSLPTEKKLTNNRDIGKSSQDMYSDLEVEL